MTSATSKVLLFVTIGLLTACQGMSLGTGATGAGASSASASESGTVDFRQTLLPEQRTASAANPRAYYYGISLASIGEAERSARNGVPIKLLAYNGVPAASRTIQNHLYGLSRPMTLITRRLPEGLQKDFIEYATSTQVIDLQLKYRFVPYE